MHFVVLCKVANIVHLMFQIPEMFFFNLVPSNHIFSLVKSKSVSNLFNLAYVNNCGWNILKNIATYHPVNFQ